MRKITTNSPLSMQCKDISYTVTVNSPLMHDTAKLNRKLLNDLNPIVTTILCSLCILMASGY